MDVKLSQFSWQYFSRPLFHIGGHHVSLFSLSICLLVIFSSLYIARFFERIVVRALNRTQVESGVANSLSRLTRYGVTAVGVMVALDVIGIGLSSLTAVGAVLMVGIGFGLQNVTQNFISGLIILLERPIKVGDLVQVHGVTGRVKSIGLRSTVVETRDEISVIVPNGQFISEQVINESHSSEKMRLHIAIGVSYGSDSRKVEQALLEVAREHPKIISAPLPKVQFTNFGDSSLDFVLLVWTRDLWANDFTRSDLRFAIAAKFKSAGITIPFPQRDIHIKTEQTV